MSDISSIGSGLVGPLNRSVPQAPVHTNGVTTGEERGSDRNDRVELSERARWLDRLRNLPEIRQERVQNLRELIASGNYETDDKIDLAMERLLNELE